MAFLARAALLLLCGCALGGGEGSGDQNLPVAGVGPFVEEEDPIVLSDPEADLTDPAPFEGALYVTRGGSEIVRAGVGAVLAGKSPSLVRWRGEVLLFYETEGGIARAVSTDGVTFSADGLVLRGGAQPGALAQGDRILLYFAQDGAIRVASSADGQTFTAHSGPVLEKGGGPFPLGRGLHVVLFYETGGGIGTAGSEDGLAFETAAKPAFASGSAPAAIASPGRVILYFATGHAGKLAIAVAHDP